ncbi:hypothetical protein D3C72_1794190 [compost metagenome]
MLTTGATDLFKSFTLFLTMVLALGSARNTTPPPEKYGLITAVAGAPGVILLGVSPRAILAALTVPTIAS